MTQLRDQSSETPTLTELNKCMRKRSDLMNLAGLCLSVAVMVAIALLAGWAAQAEAPRSSAADTDNQQ